MENQEFTAEQEKQGNIAYDCAIEVVRLLMEKVGDDDHIAVAVHGMALFATLSINHRHGGVPVKHGFLRFCEIFEFIEASAEAKKIMDKPARH
jgi:hypothetical protein